MRQLMSVLVDTQRYQMEMLSGNVLMFKDDIGLVAVTHTFHVFLRDVPELIVGQPVFRRGVQRGVEDRIGCPAVGFEVRPNYPCKCRYPFFRVCRRVRASSARKAPRLHPYLPFPCYNARLRRARSPTLYSQPFLSLFGKTQSLDTEGLQLVCVVPAWRSDAG